MLFFLLREPNTKAGESKPNEAIFRNLLETPTHRVGS
jgi:hypothetical protein